MEECYASVQSRVAGAAAGKAELGQVNRPANPNHRPNRSPYLTTTAYDHQHQSDDADSTKMTKMKSKKLFFFTFCKWRC